MPFLDVVSSTASSGQAGLTAANYLRIASISVAAYYEFVASSLSLTLPVTFIWPVFSPRSLPNTGYTRLQVGAGKAVILRDAKIDLDEYICGTDWVSHYSCSSGMLFDVVVRALAHLFCRYLSIIVFSISNTILTQACLRILLRPDGSTDRDKIKTFPPATRIYAAEYWSSPRHVQFGTGSWLRGLPCSLSVRKVIPISRRL